MLTAVIRSEISLPDLPSASGGEVVGATAYVVSDDAPLLYLLDAATLQAVGQVALFETTEFGSGRLPKAIKPDLEAMTAVTRPPNGPPGLLLLGSGSTPRRETGYFVTLPTGPVQPVNLSQLYARLRAALPTGATLNIEALAATETELLLLQRGVGAGLAGVALLLAWPLADALAHLLGPPGTPLRGQLRGQCCELPTLDNFLAGFSGATIADGQLWVTASAENTADAVLDGDVLGSLVGVLDPATGHGQYARLTWPDGRPYRGKVEGVAWRRTLPSGGAELLLVTDDDRGGSTALRVEVKFN